MPRVEGTQLVAGRYYPAITISIRVATGGGRGLAILDSGADQTMLPAEFLEAAGTEFTKLSKRAGKSIGAGGDTPATCSGELAYDGVVFATDFAVAEPGKLPFAILGREDFFKKFVIRFNWHKNPPEVHIDPVVTKKRP